MSITDVALPVFPATRWSLIARLPGRPQEAATLIGLYADAVGTYVARRLAGERAERIDDIVQEVLLDLLGKPEVLAQAHPGDGSRFRYYVMNLAWLAALNALRRIRRRDHAGLEAAADALAIHDVPPERLHDMDRAWAASVVQQALDELRRWTRDGTLKPEAYDLLAASLVEGRSLRDAAATLRIPLSTASRLLAQARSLLQRSIVERLRLAGEIGPAGDAAAACTALLALLGRE